MAATALSLLPLILNCLAAGGMVLGAALVFVGLRGRVVGRHPHCKRCGFDLHGLPKRSRRCPECGAVVVRHFDLTWPGVRIGRRERRRRPLAWGLGVGLPSTLWLSLLAATALAGWNLNRFTPPNVLARQANLGGPLGASAAAELTRRLSVGTLPAGQMREIAARFLADQADLARPWAAEKGDFLEQAQVGGKLPAAAWDRYVQQAVAPALDVRPTVRFDGPVPVKVRLDDLRQGTAAGAIFGEPGTGHGVTLSVVAQERDGTVWSIGQTRLDALDQNPARLGGGGTVAALIDLERNAHTGGPTGAGPPPVRYALVAEEGLLYLPAATRILTGWPAGELPLAVAPPGKATAVARVDPTMDATVHRTLRVAVELRQSGGVEIVGMGLVSSPVSAKMTLALTRDAADPWPLPAVWAAAFRVDGQEYAVGTAVVPKEGACEVSLVAGIGGSDALPWWLPGVDRVDVILRPDPEAAERTLSLTDFWDGEVEFKDVPVVREAR